MQLKPTKKKDSARQKCWSFWIFSAPSQPHSEAKITCQYIMSRKDEGIGIGNYHAPGCPHRRQSDDDASRQAIKGPFWLQQ